MEIPIVNYQHFTQYYKLFWLIFKAFSVEKVQFQIRKNYIIRL